MNESTKKYLIVGGTSVVMTVVISVACVCVKLLHLLTNDTDTIMKN